MAGADRAVTAAGVIDHRQARRLMFVEFPADVINRLVLVATRGRRFHDRSNADVRALAIVRRHAATHVTLGDDSIGFITSLQQLIFFSYLTRVSASFCQRSASILSTAASLVLL